MIKTAYFASPLGLIKMEEFNSLLISLNFVIDYAEKEELTPLLINLKRELSEYFAGERRRFSTPYIFHGTEFQEKVWHELSKIPHGETISYKELAQRINNPLAIRAVGGANNRNPISIIIPCHRVIGADGRLVGYGGELWRKEALLNLEKNNKK